MASNIKSTQSAAQVSNEAYRRGRINIQKVQNVVFIWLDSTIDGNNKDCQIIMAQLRRVVGDVNTYTDGEQCIQYIETIQDRKACMIMSGSLGEHLAPRIHDLTQVDSIFIFCGNKKHHEQWAKEWPKIKGVFTEIKPICDALKQAVQQCEQNAMSISFVKDSKNLDQLHPTFMYTQILKEILLTIDFNDKHIQAYVKYCREVFDDNPEELENVKLLERTYHQKQPVWWYTYECFFYRMLNRGIRMMNGDIIIQMGFFINDLHRHIEQLHKEQSFSEIFIVYRGQGLSNADFKQLKQTIGGLISFNNFLSTSKKREISLGFAENNANNPDVVGILFMMQIDPKQSRVPFASISGISDFSEEDEILFSMHSIFRIHEMKTIDENNRLYEVSLTLTSDNDKQLDAVTERIRKDSFPHANGWPRLGLVLIKMGQNEKAEEIYEILLGQEVKESRKAPIYSQLGYIKYNRGEYAEAITYHKKSLAIQEKTLSPQDPELAKCYSFIGVAYSDMGDYPKSLSYHEKDLKIKQHSLPPDHPDLAGSYNNIGLLYDKMGDYPQALSFHKKAFVILRQSFPSNHPNLALSYNNIGMVYDKMGDHPQALSYYEKALAIRQQSLPSNHPNLASSYNNIGGVYKNMKDYPKALSYYEKAFVIRQDSLPSNHPDLATSYICIGLLHFDMGDYPKALSYYEKDLKIKQHSLPLNHPDLAGSYNNIGMAYTKMADYPQALSYHEKALAIQQQSLPPSHPHFAMSYNNIGLVHENMKNYSKACLFFERAIEIGQKSLPPDHPHLQRIRNNLERVKNKL